MTEIASLNQAIIAKLFWNLQAKADKLWIKWISVYYLKNHDIMTWQAPHQCSWMPKIILKSRVIVSQTRYWEEARQKDKFTTSKMYKEIRGDVTHVIWNKVLFTNYVSPRALFIMWLIFMAHLPTKDRLTRFGVTNDDKCMFRIKSELIDHLFYGCKTTQAI